MNITIMDAAGHEVTLSGVDVAYTDTPDARLALPSDIERYRRALARIPTITPEEGQRLGEEARSMMQRVSEAVQASQPATGTVEITFPHGWDLAARPHEHHPYRWPEPRRRQVGGAGRSR